MIVTDRPRAKASAGLDALRAHWPEYLAEATGLGLFMVSACVFTLWFEYPGSSLHQAIPDPVVRRVLTGIAMGLTLIGLIYSPWGQRSGAHLNPSFTMAFLALGKIKRWDALYYVLAQFTGGILGVTLTRLAAGAALAHPAVNYAVTVPGAPGVVVAFWSEFTISLCLMMMVLAVSNTKRLARFTPLFAGTLLAAYISIEAPLSGVSMNPARTLASAVPAASYTALWVYFTAPPLGMWVAGMIYGYWRGAHRVFCAKLHHHNDKRCIFRCNYAAIEAANN